MSSQSNENINSFESDFLFDPQVGLLALKGQALVLMRHLDSLFLQWATEVNAMEYAFPPLLSVSSMNLVDYFSSFPHLATLTSQIDASDNGIQKFVEANKNVDLSEIKPDYLDSARYVVPSAACYAVYNHFRNQQLSNNLYITVCCSCSRHEDYYKAGERQWVFNMREIVCLGQKDAVKAFLDFYQNLISSKLQAANFPFKLAEATDPFFNRRDPRLLMQRLEPLKYEFLYRDQLAISSVNFHRDFFGSRFGINSQDGEVAYSGCVAFGLERWLSSCLQEYGQKLDDWPKVFQL
ncbi:hypothetical protein GS597_18490 [Synechococcales cyanobacterium C]|uniref:Seryl-tRNA synthetase n=1 Tax=Petrachloros mirabilis ULC683 TaxID=2781853 RepID=A0A8K2A249_9CYAN|nr:hypothetical protein [Petrachloros mirabilis]NCJ08458.1 hypothetical protein [Petrachloros mirabilis ULC683]